MIERIIEGSAKRPGLVFGATALFVAWALFAMKQTPLDAIPDLSDPQVIVFTDWMGRSPDLVEDQVTYPLVRALQSTPEARTVRGYSMFGMSFIYVIFEDGTDIYWARTRILEQLGRVQQILPPDVSPVLGPDATGVGWVYQYVIEDTSGRLDLAQLRELQDFTIRPALQAVTGVAEVASVGGFERQYQIVLDPNRLAAYGLSLADVTRAARDANSEVGARVLEQAGREYVLRGRGYVSSLADLEASVVSVGAGGTPVRLRDVAKVQFGPEIRRGAADWDGRGEAVGGIVVMRIGSNALEVNDAVKREIAGLSLPDGVRIVATYDRSDLIRGAVSTLTDTLLEQGVIVALICLIFLYSLRSALVVIVVIPLAVLITFIPAYHLGMTINIMSLAGIAIAVGGLEDASTTFVENGARRLSLAEPGTDRRRTIIDALKEVGRPTFFSLLLVTVSFIPLLSLTGQAGRLFRPLVLTHTFATFAAALLSVTLVPVLMLYVMRGRFRREEQNPVSRVLTRVYRPLVRLAVRGRWVVVAAAAALLVATVPIALRLGSEFMPPLDEGALLVMPTTFAGISIEEARRALTAQDQIIKGFAEVESVHGKAGRAETATDPAQLDMIESVVTLRPREDWPKRHTPRWHSGGPDWLPDWMSAPLRWVWSEEQPRTLEELSRDLDAALQMPGYQMSIAPPIRTRIDMLTTGVRTPVGIKVFGTDLAEIERVSIELEGMLRGVAGTRSTFAERQTGREYIDVIPDREAIARYGLSVRDVHDVLEAAVGGMQVSTVIAGRSRFSVNLRYASDYRADPDALRQILIPVSSSEAVGEFDLGGSGSGASPVAAGMSGGYSMGANASGGGASGMGGMGGAKAGRSSGSMSPSPAMGTTPGLTATPAFAPDPSDRWRPSGATVPLGAIASVSVVTGPPMIKDENGVLVGYVFADIDASQRDLGGWVNDAKALVARDLSLPPGYRLQWTGQYEFMEEMEARMAWVVPLTLLLVVFLLRRGMRGWSQTGLVLTSLPFALIGSIWLLYLQDYNLSTAVWVGLIAVIGTASETGILMVEFLDQAITRQQETKATLDLDDVNDAVVDGASSRVRPIVMSVASTVLGLLPLLWEAGPGADVSARIAAPVVGGLLSCLLLTLLVLPATYTIWRRWQVRRGHALTAPVPGPEAAPGDMTPSSDGTLGLTTAEAARRLTEFGRNEIAQKQTTSPWRLLAEQFESPVIWLLLAACVVSAVLGDLADAIAIGSIVLINAGVGFFQEYRAERAVLALRSMTAPRARLIRDGRTVDVDAAEVVPGDCLVLEAGDVVAADARLVEANRLSTLEAALTGESAAVDKSTVAVAAGTLLAERHDAVFMGTSVANGTGKACVTATGGRTELGKIGDLLEGEEDDSTPLQKRLARVSRLLLYICGGIVVAVAVAGILRGVAPFDVFLSAVSLAVAAVPEGLPAIVTIALSIGVKRMAARHVLVRRLHSVETLGCATVICTDKTGTLTTGVMTVRELSGPDHKALIDAAAACCDAELAPDEHTGIGDPTEIALLVAAAEQGIRRADIERDRPRVAVVPFDTARKRMSILRGDGTLYLKGAVEVVTGFCTSGTEGATEANAELSGSGLRVLAVAVGAGGEEKNLRLLGLVGIADPPRPEAIAAVAAARAAGITSVMITGDHKETALAIARELGILRPEDRPEEVVHARASPEDKLEIVKSWKARGAVVAMTGDGVNDAPALRAADIGIAMGRTGTEVTREASDMVLTDDNFASIVAAVREGRGIFDNIRKTLVYLLAGNTAELGVMLAAAVAGLPLPLLPLHLLWINLVTDGLPALALVTDPPDADVLERSPRRPDEPMLGRAEWTNILLTGLLEASVTLAVFAWALQDRGLTEARSLAFSVLVFGELFRAFAARSPTRLFWETGVFSNLRLLSVVVLSVAIQLALHHIPAAQALFQIGALSLADCALGLAVGLIPVTVIELSKLVRRGLRARSK